VTLSPRGGGVALVSRLARAALRERWGADCTVVTLLPDDGVDGPLHAGLASRVGFGARLAVRQALGECDWIFYGHPSLAQVQRYVPDRFRRPYVIFVHGIEAWRPLSQGEREVFAGAAVRLTNSTYTAERVRHENPDLPGLTVCPLALVPGEAVAPTVWHGPSLGPHAVMIVGRMMAAERYKGHDALLDAWHLVRARVPDATLVFAGDGDDVGRLREKAAPLGDDAVRFTGFLTTDQLHAAYDRAAVFAMPSRGEGFGLVYLEAMAHGLPCVGSVHDAAREIIEDGVTGYLVDQADSGALAGRLIDLLVDPDRRAAMGARGRARLAREFSFARFADRLVAALESAPAIRSGAGAEAAARTGTDA
jgi:phosphatidylinositol alpha-1,6-mannosyltransferase